MFPLCKFLTTVGFVDAFAIIFVAFSDAFAEIATKPINELFNLKMKKKSVLVLFVEINMHTINLHR